METNPTKENLNGKETNSKESVKKSSSSRKKGNAILNEEKSIKEEVKKQPVYPPGGGPEIIQIDWASFDQLCAIHCTAVEIASFFNCSVDTIERRVYEKYGFTFAEIFKVKSGKGKISLRRKQWEIAMSGDKTMLIWLGKVWMGQTEPQDPDQQDASLSQLFVEWLSKKNGPDEGE